MSKRIYIEILHDMFSVWIIATTSLCLGMLLNQFNDKPLGFVYQSKTQRLQNALVNIGIAQADSRLPSILHADLTLQEFRNYVTIKRGLILDARPEIFHRLGHVPGALSFPREDLENSYSKFRPQLEADKGQPLAIYCSNANCQDSVMVQEALIRLGYTNVAVFRGGWSIWSDAGLPVEKTP